MIIDADQNEHFSDEEVEQIFSWLKSLTLSEVYFLKGLYEKMVLQ